MGGIAITGDPMAANGRDTDQFRGPRLPVSDQDIAFDVAVVEVMIACKGHVATIRADGGPGLIRQGYQERSNVAVVDELVGLILAQRNYEINSRAIRVSDEMLQQVNQMTR